jgi:D-alanyl-D-alanine carboxypeptidase (penicillin-binding protein 5/6)
MWEKLGLWIMVICILGLLTTTTPSTAFGVTETPPIMGSAACVIDAWTGIVIYDKDGKVQRAPASTTKMITCLLVLENLNLETQVIIDKEVIATKGNTLEFKEGEILSVKDLVYGMMVYSANDAAVALAKEVSGSIPAFVDLMNMRAKELGAENTNFLNPHGLTETGHVSTAYDLAMIARGCMENELFRTICKTPSYKMSANFKSPEREIYTTNLLLTEDPIMVTVGGILRPVKYDSCVGIKTGFTLAAGNCLVAAATKNGTTFISVVLNSGELERFSDSIALLDWSYDNYRSNQTVVKGEPVDKVKIKGGAILNAPMVGDRDHFLLIPNDAADSVVTTKVILEKGLSAPISKGAIVGKIEVYEGDRLVDTINGVLEEDIIQGTFLTKVGIPDKFGKPIIIFFVGILALLILFVFTIIVARIIVKRKKARRRRERALEIAQKRIAEAQDKEKRNWRY